MLTERFRDLTLVNLSSTEKLVIACDSSGGIGDKEKDLVRVTPYIVGRFISRVPLMELMASGASLITLINTLAVEMEPTGKEIIRGIREEMETLGVEVDNLINGSTEDNIPMVQTALGITAIGKVTTEKCKLGKSRSGDKLYVAGIPKVGEEVMLDDPEIADLRTITSLLEIKEVKEILPVGSKGIKKEVEQLCDSINSTVELSRINLDLKKSAGPVTCLIFTMERSSNWDVSNLTQRLNLPVYYLGELK